MPEKKDDLLGVKIAYGVVVVCILVWGVASWSHRRGAADPDRRPAVPGVAELEVDVDGNGEPDKVWAWDGRFALAELNGEPVVNVRETGLSESNMERDHE